MQEELGNRMTLHRLDSYVKKFIIKLKNNNSNNRNNSNNNNNAISDNNTTINKKPKAMTQATKSR